MRLDSLGTLSVSYRMHGKSLCRKMSRYADYKQEILWEYWGTLRNNRRWTKYLCPHLC